MMNTSTKLWGGRFRSDLSTETEAFTQSIDVDSRLVPHDIWGSQVHAIMLARQGIISDEDLRQILHWLSKAESDFRDGKFVLKPEKEDVHMNVESYLIEGAGSEYGGKLHTARSRNDQVLVDAHLYIREQLLDTQQGCIAFVPCVSLYRTRSRGNGNAGLYTYTTRTTHQSWILGDSLCQHVSSGSEAIECRLRTCQSQSTRCLCACREPPSQSIEI